MDWTGIVASIITVALGVSLVWVKAEKIILALKELANLLTVVVNSLSDQKLTVDEINSIKKEAGELLAAFKAIIGK